MPHNRWNSSRALTRPHLLVVLLFWLFVQDYSDLAKIFFFSAATSFCVISHTFVPFCLSNDTSMHPKSHGIQTFVSCVINQIVKGSDHKFCNFFMTFLKDMNGFENVSFSNDDKCFSGSNSKLCYFLIEVIMYFLTAESVTFGLISTGSGWRIQQLVLRLSFWGFTANKLWFIRTFTLFLGLKSLAGKLIITQITFARPLIAFFRFTKQSHDFQPLCLLQDLRGKIENIAPHKSAF